MVNLDSILQTYTPISLAEMDRVELMNRKETKFFFCSNRLAEILEKASEHYMVLEIDHLRSFLYRSTYMDTKDYTFFNHHARGKLNRFKVRYRVYESTGGSYLEIKCKSNKMRTIKWRIKNNMQNGSFDPQAEKFLAKHIGPDKKIHPVLVNCFNRITLVGKNINERITLDFNISFAEIDGEKIELPYLAIAEMKYEKSNGASPFYKLLRELKIRPGSISKYCIGSIMINNTQRVNVFKPKLLTLEKIKDDYFPCASA